MPVNPFILVTPGATRGLGVALTRQFLRTTTLPVFATTRTSSDLEAVRKIILDGLEDVRAERLNLIRLDLTSEDSIASAADDLAKSLKHQQLDNAYIHSAFITGGMLKPEKRLSDLNWNTLKDTFQINVISHLLIIKHFHRFLPNALGKNLTALPNGFTSLLVSGPLKTIVWRVVFIPVF
jgi:NAD(P)-dependent dehydrogenase (short-subunit alcohol dehydrogenase family)